WRTTPPEPPTCAGTLRTAVEINLDCGLLEPEAEIDPDTGDVLDVPLGGLHLSRDQWAQIVGEAEAQRQEKLIRGRLADLIQTAADDEYGNRADAAYDDWRPRNDIAAE